MHDFWIEWGLDREDLENFAGAAGIAALLYFLNLLGCLL